jgi:hypothetical protein
MGRDLRAYARQTNTRLLIGFIILLFIIGDGLVYLIYGPRAAVLGGLCLVGGLAPLLLIWLIFVGIDWIVKKNRDNE